MRHHRRLGSTPEHHADRARVALRELKHDNSGASEAIEAGRCATAFDFLTRAGRRLGVLSAHAIAAAGAPRGRGFGKDKDRARAKTAAYTVELEAAFKRTCLIPSALRGVRRRSRR